MHVSRSFRFLLLTIVSSLCHAPDANINSPVTSLSGDSVASVRRGPGKQSFCRCVPYMMYLPLNPFLLRGAPFAVMKRVLR